MNAGDVPLSGLTVVTTNLPPNLNVTAALVTNSLDGLATNQLSFIIAASDDSYSQATIGLIVTSAEGAVIQIPVNVTIQTLAPNLVALPGQLVAGVTLGTQRLVSFQVVNLGSAASGPVSVSLPGLSWLSLASANPLPPLAPGATNTVTLRLAPPADLALTTYSGNLALNASGSALSVPFQFRALSEAKGDLKIVAVDELTFYAAGSPPVTNATVTITDSTTGNAITNGVTDATGSFLPCSFPKDIRSARHGAAAQRLPGRTSWCWRARPIRLQAFVRSRPSIHLDGGADADTRSIHGRYSGPISGERAHPGRDD